MRHFTLAVLGIVALIGITGLFLSLSQTNASIRNTYGITGKAHLSLSVFGAEGVAVWAEDTTGATTPATFAAEAGVLLADGTVSPSLYVGVENLTIRATSPTGKQLIVYEKAYISDTKTVPDSLAWIEVSLKKTESKYRTYSIGDRTETLTGFIDAAETPVDVSLPAQNIPFTLGDDNFVVLFVCNEVEAGMKYDCNGNKDNEGPWVLHEIKGFITPTIPPFA